MELTTAIEIADADGRLRRDAIGWSRHPLHRCNLDGVARAHAFDYWCVLSPGLAVTFLVADVGLAGVALVSVLDLASGKIVERVYVRPGGLPVAMPADPDGEVVLDAWRLQLTVGPRRLVADARTLTGRRIEVDVAIDRPAGHETVNVLVPWDDTRFHFTSKQQALPARGVVRVDGRAHAIDAFACRDFGRGRRPAGIDWCWAFASARVGARTIGLNLGARWTDDTGVTENALVIDGRVHKLDDDVDFELGARAWRIRTRRAGRVDLTFTPRTERAVRVPPVVRLRQCVGTFAGTIVDDHGAAIALDGVLGVAETVPGAVVMHVVALLRLASPIEDVAKALAARSGTLPYAERQKLAVGVPAIVLETPDAGAAASLLAALRAAGHDATSVTDDEVVASEDMVAIRRFELEGDALVGETNRLPWDDLACLLRATHRTSARTKTTVKEKKFSIGKAIATGGLVMRSTTTRDVIGHAGDSEPVLYLFRRSGQRPWLLAQHRAQYAALGDRRAATAAPNFALTVAELRARAPRAVFDDRLLARKEPPDELDVLAHLLAGSLR